MDDLNSFYAEDPNLANGNQQNQYQGNQQQRNQYQGNQQNQYQGNQGNQQNQYQGNQNNQYQGNNQGSRGNYSEGYKKKPYGNYNKEKEVDLTNFSFYMPYTIAGSMNVPKDVLGTVKELSSMMERNKFTLRVSTSTEVDDAAIAGLSTSTPEVYIPWRGFNNIESKHYFNDAVSLHIAKMFHRGFDTLKPAVQAFLARNVRMIMGGKLSSYSIFVVMWSEDGAERIDQITPKTGYSSHVISIADTLRIPVYNLQNPNILDRVTKQFRLS